MSIQRFRYGGEMICKFSVGQNGEETATFTAEQLDQYIVRFNQRRAEEKRKALSMLRRGLTVKQVAAELGMQASSVAGYLGSDCEKSKLLREIEELKAQKNSAYAERNKLVAALTKTYDSVLFRHPDEDKEWEDDWRWIVCVNLPTGQATWHIHDSELPMFAHVPHGKNQWDGHNTEQNYTRLAGIPAKKNATPPTAPGRKVDDVTRRA